MYKCKLALRVYRVSITMLMITANIVANVYCGELSLVLSHFWVMKRTFGEVLC